MIFISEIVIKKNILITPLSIITSLFIFLLMIGDPLGIYYILFVDFTFENLFFFMGLIMFFLIGLSNLISIILFGMKAFVINDIGITYCKWNVKTIYWKDIKNIKLKYTDYKSSYYELIIFMKNGKKKTIGLINISTKISEKEIYKLCLEKLHKRR